VLKRHKCKVVEYLETNIREAFYKNNGILKSSKLKELGITSYELKKLIDADVIERIMKGYYKLVGDDISDVKLISVLIPEAVLSFDSALYYYGYSDRTPAEWHIAVNKDISKSRVRIDYPYLKPYFIEPYLLNIGVNIVSIEEVEIKMFSRERVICDCLKYESKFDIEMFNKALIRYVNDPQKNISKLLEIAKLRGVEKKVYDKIGTWL